MERFAGILVVRIDAFPHADFATKDVSRPVALRELQIGEFFAADSGFDGFADVLHGGHLDTLVGTVSCQEMSEPPLPRPSQLVRFTTVQLSSESGVTRPAGLFTNYFRPGGVGTTTLST